MDQTATSSSGPALSRRICMKVAKTKIIIVEEKLSCGVSELEFEAEEKLLMRQ